MHTVDEASCWRGAAANPHLCHRSRERDLLLRSRRRSSGRSLLRDLCEVCNSGRLWRRVVHWEGGQLQGLIGCPSCEPMHSAWRPPQRGRCCGCTGATLAAPHA
jgi:hypothetical protein